MEPRAFWIRYTVFSPRGHPEDAVGQLWAVYFDGTGGRHVAVKQPVPIAGCLFSREPALDVRIGGARLDDGAAIGALSTFAWDLAYSGGGPPLTLLTRVVCPRPRATFGGSLTVEGDRVPIDGWVGSQNHNWGRKHADRYAWGQVVGFDDDPTAVLECTTAKLKLGPVWTPRLSFLVLRLGDRELRCSVPRTRGAYDDVSWQLRAKHGKARIAVSFDAPKEAFVALAYENPPGGTKTCLNTKLASCRVVVEEAGKPPLRLKTESRAAFEILT